MSDTTYDDLRARALAAGATDAVIVGPSSVVTAEWVRMKCLYGCIPGGCLKRAQAAGTELYGGGQFKLGVGRDHIQALASLFYADGPNDVAPRDYHGAAHPAVPSSPLEPVPGLDQAPGFGFALRR